MEQEKKQVMEMTEYIDYVDGKLSELLSELSEVKSQLSNIQNRSLKTAMEAIVGKIEEKAHHLKEQVLSVKNRTARVDLNRHRQKQKKRRQYYKYHERNHYIKRPLTF